MNIKISGLLGACVWLGFGLLSYIMIGEYSVFMWADPWVYVYMVFWPFIWAWTIFWWALAVVIVIVLVIVLWEYASNKGWIK